MKTGITVFATGMLAAVAALAPAAAQTLPPVEAFGALPFLSQPQLSPDGKHFAGIQSLDGKPAAVIYTVNSPDPPQVFASTEWLITSLTWAKNDRVVMFTKMNKTAAFATASPLFTWHRALSLAVGSNDWVQLFDRRNESVSQNSATIIVDRMPGDADGVLMPLWTRPKDDRVDNDPNSQIGGGYADYRFSLYRVDVRTGRATVVQDGSTMPSYWITDGEGHVVGRVDETKTPLVDHLRLYNDGSWSNARDFDARPDFGVNVFGLTYDGSAIAVASVNESGRDALVRLERDTAKTGATLFGDARYDVAYALGDDWTGRVNGAAYMADRMQYVYFDPARAALQHRIEQVFPDEDAHAVSVTQDGSSAIVAVESPQRPRTYYLMGRDTPGVTKITSEYPSLKASDLGVMQPYPYKARDGLDIPAYITLPPGRAPRNLPLIVMPHGGPDARDAMRFDWWAQFLANRGYAVFQPNFRGSKGYGHDFDAAGFHQWGLKMQDDITDGVKKLIADGTADGRRVCIVGASYGGYAALAGATFTPDLYACAVSVAGISNLTSMLDEGRRMGGPNSGYMAFLASRVGTKSDDGARLDATSPVLHADQVKIPVLLMHGRLDTTVPYAQSENEEAALRRAGKDVQLVTFDADDHYLGLAETRIKMLTTLEAFLKAHIGG